MSEDLAFTYDEKKNLDGRFLDGVPLRDLTKAEYAKLTKPLQKAVEREPFYVEVKKTDKPPKGDK